MKSCVVCLVFTFLSTFNTVNCNQVQNDTNCYLNSKNFPWVVFIPLSPRSYNPQANVRCAGVLVSERYILTSSTCLQFVLKNVQVGRYDTSKQEPTAVEVAIDKWVKYDNANIALLKLQDEVKFTDRISPICFPNNMKMGNVEQLYTSGWGLIGKTGPNSITKKIVGHTLTNCNIPHTSTVCLQVQNKTNSACTGDEGSPIMYQENNSWVLYGILTAVFDDDGTPCSINDPAVGVLMTDEIITWLMKEIKS